jgi:hypothetical protein
MRRDAWTVMAVDAGDDRQTARLAASITGTVFFMA